MADYLTTTEELTSIADAIREKGGTEDPLAYPTGFVDAIEDISGGGGAGGTYTATILTQGLNNTNWPAYSLVRYKGTKYYTANSTFQFTGGETLEVRLQPMASELTMVVVVDGEIVASQAGSNLFTYNYTLPEHDIKIMLKQDAIGISPTRSSYQFIAATQYTVNTSSTSATSVGTFDTGDTSIWTSNKMVYVKIRKKSMTATGFVGTDCFFYNSVPGNGESGTSSFLMHGTLYQRVSGGGLAQTRSIGYSNGSAASGYGVYSNFIYNDGKIDIKARYNASYTGTISGDFTVEVYLLDWPCGISPFYDSKA